MVSTLKKLKYLVHGAGLRNKDALRIRGHVPKQLVGDLGLT